MTTDFSHNLSIKQMDMERMFHPMTSIADHLEKGPFVLSGAKGIRVTDIDGREFIDAGAGLWCMNVGYGRDEIADAAADAMKRLGYYHLFAHASNEPIIRLADKVLQLLHQEAGATHMSKVFFGCSGSDANDTNYKLVRYYNNLRGRPQKKKFIARTGAYHGLTYVSAGLTGIASYHKAFDVPLDGILHTSCPHYYRFHQDGESEAQYSARLIRDLEELIAREGPDTIAAFIAEPIMGVGGVAMPPAGYFDELQKLLKAHDILFIADEVITGFGRTGSWFGTGLLDLRPDIISLAKGLTSAYIPASASVISEEIWEVLRQASPEAGPVMHGFTYAGHPVAGAVGLKVMEIMEREDLVGNAADVGAYLLSTLRERLADHPFVGEVRGVGLMIAVEFIADKASRRPFDAAAAPHKLVAGKCLDEGMLCRALPFIEATAFSPPLTLTKAEADEMVERYDRALEAATPDLQRLSV